ncbi:hypothetical protein ACIA6C_14870 [Streptomyces sp. NPDC051578]|uniref:hypothetical protein n=1 Tax=Streptomyces sp. NPDC051578 TaxID=3365662 RepID=UPI0037AAF4C8
MNRALLHVAHRDDPGAAGGPPPMVTVTLTGPGIPRSCATPQKFAAHQGALTTDTLDQVVACGLTDPAQLTGLVVTYTATRGAGSATALEQLDGVTLELAYRPPLSVRPTKASSTPTPTAAAFLNPKNAQAIDTTTSTATLATATPSASIQLGAFSMPPLPAGAVIDKVVLRISHQDDDTTQPPPSPSAPPSPRQPPTAALTVSGTGTACDANHALTSHEGALGVDVVDLGACGVTKGDQLSKLAVDYAARLSTGSTEAADQLDGVELDIVFRAPSIRAPSGCPTEGSSCAVLKSTADADTTTDHSRLLINGTVYAPTAAVDLSMSQVGSQVVTRGIIARTIALGISPAAGYLRPVIGIPPEPVLFTTYPAVITKPASVTGITGFTPPAPGAAVDVSDATLPGGGRASLTLSDYAQPAPATTGPLDHVVLQMAHHEELDAESVKVSVDFPGSTCTGVNHALDVPVIHIAVTDLMGRRPAPHNDPLCTGRLAAVSRAGQRFVWCSTACGAVGGACGHG